MGGGVTNEDLAMPGRRDGAGFIRPSAGAKHWTVPDAARHLCGHASGRGRGREITGGIASHRSDGAVPCRVIARVLSLQASPLELRLQGYTLDEVAQQVGCTERTVRRSLDRIKSHLERWLVERSEP